ncbi:MAG: alpha/beta hydrolase [Desulfobacteraceae bacterium]|nr:alpha/beta hydrolase [Desulfobacteraceae bacterium]
MPTIQVNQHHLYYETYGQGTPLIFIAGLGTSCLMWWKQIEPFSKKYQVVILDNRGIGDSSRVSQAFTVADMAADVAALIRAIGLPPSHVLGVSMGGFVALTFAGLYPQLIKKLIAVSTSAGGPGHVQTGNEMLEIIMSSSQGDVEAYCRRVYPALAGPGHMQAHPEDLDHIVANALKKPLPPETYLYQLNAIMKYTSDLETGADLRSITAPTLVLHGDADALVPYPNGRYLADHIKGAKLHTYPGCGHLLPIEAADRFNKDVMAFLE